MNGFATVITTVMMSLTMIPQLRQIRNALPITTSINRNVTRTINYSIRHIESTHSKIITTIN